MKNFFYFIHEMGHAKCSLLFAVAGRHLCPVSAPLLQVDEVRHHLSGRSAVGDHRQVPQRSGQRLELFPVVNVLY